MSIEGWQQRDPEESQPDPMNNRTILVIDDEEAFCDVVCEILESNGHLPLHAHTAAQALEILRDQTPDLILSDVMMPDIDGLTFIRHLRSNPKWTDIPIIVVSAKASIADQDAAQSVGADGYLVKPFSTADLELTIASALIEP
jgi:CheY-like chemotaxis protein